jgi:hypothetical protein
MDKTGMARGHLKPIIYYKNRVGYILLAAFDAGKPEQARQFFQFFCARNPEDGWQWCEACTLNEVKKLQDALIEQDLRTAESQRTNSLEAYDRGKARISARLQARRREADCPGFEREWIDAVLARGEQKRKRFIEKMYGGQSYLWALEMDDKSKVEDRIKTEVPKH